jgi:hypothetical protein
MPLLSAPPLGEQALMRSYYRYVEPIQIAWRKRSRMGRFGIESLHEIACGEIDLASSSPYCVPVCAEIVEAHRVYLAKYLFCDGRTISRLWRGIPLVINLDLYPDFESYVGRLRRRWKEVQKADQRGFHCRPIDRNLDRFELFEIDTSRKFRSGGPVIAAFLRRPPARASAETARGEPVPSGCPLHWYSEWGVFSPEGAHQRSDGRLVGYLFLKRVGNVVRLTSLMGHGAYLADGVVKLLFAKAMRWLVTREDPSVRSIRYLHYGAIEHGGAGLVAWKQRFGFEPLLFRWPKTLLVWLMALFTEADETIIPCLIMAG